MLPNSDKLFIIFVIMSRTKKTTPYSFPPWSSMTTKVTVELIPDIFLILFVIALFNDCVLSDFTFTKIS